jgi:hypothetical protein
MNDDLVMDVSGSWVRPAKQSAAVQLDQTSDASEDIFFAHQRGKAKPICVTSHDRDDVCIQTKFHSN